VNLPCYKNKKKSKKTKKKVIFLSFSRSVLQERKTFFSAFPKVSKTLINVYKTNQTPVFVVQQQCHISSLVQG